MEKLEVLLRKLKDLLQKKPIEEIEYLPLPPKPPIVKKTNREKLLEYALQYLGRDVTPEDNVPDDVACASSFCRVLKGILPDFPDIPYTLTLFRFLQKDSRWQASLDLLPGNAIISPTTLGNGKIPNGHVGIISKDSKIMSNNSKNGLWEENFTINSWIDRYRTQGGYPIYIFQLKDYK